MPETSVLHQASVTPDLNGQRFDQVAAALFPNYSRARLQSWIRSGELTVDGSAGRPKDRIYTGSKLHLAAELQPVAEGWVAQAIDLDIVYEDDDLIVINKPAGLVVHPAAGHQDGTLLNALLHIHPSLELVPRAGIVHRLDKETTGLMVVARNLPAQTSLVAQLQARSVHREYEAVVVGLPTGGGTVDAPIGRHPRDRQRMAVVREESPSGKPAITHYRLIRRFRAHTHLRCLLETGRTHQIRVHMAHINLPLVGDTVYGGRFRIASGMDSERIEALRGFPRQALHARRLELTHPRTGAVMNWETPLPDDMVSLLALLDADHRESQQDRDW
jgi:23S rRNA pseudouridine1911/1915/1917 synthase